MNRSKEHYKTCFSVRKPSVSSLHIIRTLICFVLGFFNLIYSVSITCEWEISKAGSNSRVRLIFSVVKKQKKTIKKKTSNKPIKSWLWPSSILWIHDVPAPSTPVHPFARSSCPDPTVHLQLLTSSTADSIGGVLSAKKEKKKKKLRKK